MPDDKKEKPGPNGKKEAAKPLEKGRVHVTVTPERGRDPQDARKKMEYGRKVKVRLAEDVKKAVSDNKDGGAAKQLDAAVQKTKEAGTQISRQAVREIKVKVEGEIEGQKVSKEVTVVPKEGEQKK